MSRAPSKEDLRAWVSVIRTYHLCNAALIHRLKPLGLKLAQFEVLVRLLHEPGQSQQQLAANSFVVKSHMSGLLAEMIEQGWVKRGEQEGDKRSKPASLTAKGQALARKAAAVQDEVVGAMFAPLTRRQISDTEQIMKTVSDTLLNFGER